MIVVETCPVREGQLSTEDLQQGMKLQPCHNDEAGCLIEVVEETRYSELRERGAMREL